MTTPRKAASIILVRDSANGLEVFMVARNYAIDSFSGALVFPGGKLDTNDMSSALRARCRNQHLYNDEQLGMRVASVREAFEESGALLVRDAESGEFPNSIRMEQLGVYRGELEQGGISLLEILQRENLELATDLLAYFSNWVTPENWPAKRFDTHFYVAEISGEILLEHDGSETVDSLWATPQKIRSMADEGKWNVVFPTRSNLSKVEKYSTVKSLMEDCQKTVVDKIMPTYEKEGNKAKLSISRSAGFPYYEVEMDVR